GTGRGRAPLLRAHPLLEDGVISGRAFGRTLVHGGLERQEWIWTFKSLRVGLSLFVDGARPRNALPSVETPWQIDGGGGIRLAGMGKRGEIRIMAAHGFEDGESAISVAWEVR
ncbi:MAG TPA: hypothetical protein VJW75_00575, partial [Candidatus Eisenbacteria bacterium]|nr:hypothetical protein [Candidatus Eisenbacteria bacterium]